MNGFEEWWESEGYVNKYESARDASSEAWEAAWDKQQKRIDKLEWDLSEVTCALKEQKKLNSFLYGKLKAAQEEEE